MKMSVVKSLVFWIGMILLVVDLATYYTSIKLYFTMLGQVLLVVSLLVLIVSFFIKSKK